MILATIKGQSNLIDLSTVLYATEGIMWKSAQQKTAPSLRAVSCEVYPMIEGVLLYHCPGIEAIKNRPLGLGRLFA
jgi:hypothetical protein